MEFTEEELDEIFEKYAILPSSFDKEWGDPEGTMIKLNKLRALENILKDLDLKVNISGCGCCGSPWVKVEHKGIVVFDDYKVKLTMIPDKDK